jgi:hypothetical protein
LARERAQCSILYCGGAGENWRAAWGGGVEGDVENYPL